MATVYLRLVKLAACSQFPARSGDANELAVTERKMVAIGGAGSRPLIVVIGAVLRRFGKEDWSRIDCKQSKAHVAACMAGDA